MGQGYSEVGTFWGVLNVSLCVYDVQLGNFEQHTLSKVGGEDKALQTDRGNPLKIGGEDKTSQTDKY